MGIAVVERTVWIDTIAELPEEIMEVTSVTVESAKGGTPGELVAMGHGPAGIVVGPARVKVALASQAVQTVEVDVRVTVEIVL